MCMRLLIASSIAGFLIASAASAAPFGLTMGATAQALKGTPQDGALLISVPEANAEFEMYAAMAPPGIGLCKINAIGVTHENDAYGSTTLRAYEAMKEALTARYGKPDSSYNFLKTGSIWNEPRDWVASILRNERNMITFWGVKTPLNSNEVSAISLSVKATSSDDSYISLKYDLMNFASCEEVGSKASAAGL